MKIKNDEQAYLHALVLSITAPTEEKSQECIQIAELIGSRLTAKQRNLPPALQKAIAAKKKK